MVIPGGLAMPRTSPYRIRLTTAEAAELQRRAAKYTLPYFQVQRAKIVLLAAEGLTNEEIAARLNTRREVGVAVAQTLLLGTPGGPGRAPAPGSPTDFFPLTWWCKSKPGPVNCRRLIMYPCRAGARLI